MHEACGAFLTQERVAQMARSSSIELRHLRYFVAAADHGSFRKAGTAVDVKESAISRRIRDLRIISAPPCFSVIMAGYR
jgi:hypothetical protein